MVDKHVVCCNNNRDDMMNDKDKYAGRYEKCFLLQHAKKAI